MLAYLSPLLDAAKLTRKNVVAMVIGLVLWALSVGVLIIAAAVSFAVRNGELYEKISKCYVMGSKYTGIVSIFFLYWVSLLYSLMLYIYTGIVSIVYWILSLIIVLIDAVLWIATAAVVAPQEGIIY